MGFKRKYSKESNLPTTFKKITVLNLIFSTILVPINTKSKTPVFNIQLIHGNGWPFWMSIFFITRKPNFLLSTPGFELTIDCLMTRTQFSNWFYNTLAFYISCSHQEPEILDHPHTFHLKLPYIQEVSYASYLNKRWIDQAWDRKEMNH